MRGGGLALARVLGLARILRVGLEALLRSGGRIGICHVLDEVALLWEGHRYSVRVELDLEWRERAWKVRCHYRIEDLSVVVGDNHLKVDECLEMA